MAILTSPAVPTTTAVAQYLFRVYLNPIVGNVSQFRVFEMVEDLTGEEDAPFGGWEINFADYLISMPPETSIMADIANRLVLAHAALGVDGAISGVAVFLVETAKPINEETPVAYFHPYKNAAAGYDLHVFIFLATELDNPGIDPGDNVTTEGFGSLSTLQGFRTYDLKGDGHGSGKADPFLALDVARNCETGRAQHQMLKGVVLEHDMYRTQKGDVVYDPEGTLGLMRFDWYKATIESLPYTHSGYALNSDGSIRHAPIAYGGRIANGITDLAVARRQYIRRKYATRIVLSSWHYAHLKMAEHLYYMDVMGFPIVESFDTSTFGGSDILYLRINTQWLESVCGICAEFLNIFYIANGGNSLLMYEPLLNDDQQFTIYQRLYNRVFPTGYNFQPFVLRDDTELWSVVLAMCDIMAYIHDTIAIFNAEDATQTANAHLLSGVPYIYAKGLQGLARNQFALKYEELQGEAQKLMQLMCTFQFCFRPIESEKPTTEAEQLRSKPVKHHLPDRLYIPYIKQNTGLHLSSLESRIAWDMPEFLPYRIWVPQFPPSGANQAVMNGLKAVSMAALQANLASVRSAEAAKKAARQAARAAEIAALRAALAADPNYDDTDPYDYRNYTRAKFWTTPLTNAQIPRFLANVVNTPTALDVALDAYGISQKTRPFAKNLEKTIALVDELAHPWKIVRGKALKTEFKLIVKTIGSPILKFLKGEVVSNAKDKTVTTITNPTGGYEPRQIFPQY